MVLVLLLQGCAATVVCPEVEGESRAMMLLDHGRHASLVVERDDGTMVRYSYGDRRWYAEDDTGFGAGLAATLGRPPAVLHRMELGDDTSAASVRAALGLVVEEEHVFRVPAGRADALVVALDAIFHADPGAVSTHPRLGLEFAPHPVPYSTTSHNSNHVVAGWLDELGCTTSGSPMTSNWRVP